MEISPSTADPSSTPWDQTVTRRVLIVIAHPDDAEFTSGGTIAQWAGQGWDIRYVVCTDGSKGKRDRGTPGATLAAKRQKEQIDAARLLGVKEVFFLVHPDGHLVPDDDLRAELTLLIRRLRPHILLTWDPWRHYQIHSDHRATGEAALNAVMAAENPSFYTEQLSCNLQAHRVEEVWLFGADAPDQWVDITSTFQQKLAAIRKHVSQVENINDLQERTGSWNASLGISKGFAYAEAFKVLRPFCEICR